MIQDVSMGKVMASMGEVLEFAGTMLDYIIDNPVLGFMFASSLVGIGIGVIMSIKRAASRR